MVPFYFKKSNKKLIDYRNAHLNLLYKIFLNLNENTHILTGSSILLLNFIDRKVNDIDILVKSDDEYITFSNGILENNRVTFIKTIQYNEFDYNMLYNPLNKKFIKCHSIQQLIHSKLQFNNCGVNSNKHLKDLIDIKITFDYESEINQNF